MTDTPNQESFSMARRLTVIAATLASVYGGWLLVEAVCPREASWTTYLAIVASLSTTALLVKEFALSVPQRKTENLLLAVLICAPIAGAVLWSLLKM